MTCGCGTNGETLCCPNGEDAFKWPGCEEMPPVEVRQARAQTVGNPAEMCGAPRCTAPLTDGIHVAGSSSVLQLPAAAGCQHATPSITEARSILSGSWLKVCGSSK